MRAGRKTPWKLAVALGCVALAQAQARAARPAGPEFTPCEPETDYSADPTLAAAGPEARTEDFCASWNPEFPFNGHRCCTKIGFTRRERRNRCPAQRRKSSFCSEMTGDEREYESDVESGKIDPLKFISEEIGHRREQSFCNVNNGFLAYGRSIVPTSENRVALRTPGRCTRFGTDGMVGMLEWLGRQVAQEYAASEYKGVRLVIGDVSAPRGGCLPGRAGRRGHASHTSGQDADVGFLTASPHRPSPLSFHRNFDPEANWWMIKRIFNNPYACVKVIFLDNRLKSKLARAIHRMDDPKEEQLWAKYGRFIRHVPGHRNHMHVRIGAELWHSAGVPGCGPNAHPELEPGDEGEPGASPAEEALDLIQAAPLSK